MLKLEGFDAKTRFSKARLSVGRVSIDFILLPGGPMKWMGKLVYISNPFFISTIPVTQSLWSMIMGLKTSHFTHPQRPAERVCWHEAVKFCNELSELSGRDAPYRINRRKVSVKDDVSSFRLPTESEWLFAAKAGKGRRFAGADQPGPIAWFDENSGKMTQPVGQKQANEWGLFDMCGNVWEWCWDYYSQRLPDGTDRLDDYLGPNTGDERVCRGGSWREGPEGVSLNVRFHQPPSAKRPDLGFRLVFSTFPPS